MGNSNIPGQGNLASFKKCLPSSKLVTLPQNMNGGPGDLITYFHAKPPGYSLPSSTSEDQLFWWTDIDFIPFKDNCLFVSVGAYINRPNRSPIKASPLLQGLIYVWTFGESKHRVEILKGSKSSAFPNISVHPSGECILYIGTGNIHLVNMFSMKSVTKSKDANMSNFQCCAQSPSGYHFVYVSKMSAKVKLGFCYLDNGTYLLDRGLLDCDKLCRGFRSDGSFRDRYQCKFSKDSSYVAVSSSFGHLLVIAFGKLELHCDISPGLIDWTTDRLANERCFDFDPSYGHEKIAFGSDRGKVYFCDTDQGKVENSIRLDDNGEIQCLKYSPSGNLLAVALSLGVVRLLEPESGDCQLTLDAVNVIQDAAIKTVLGGELAQVIRMTYTTHGEHLAVSYTDGYVRVWKLTQDLNLQDLCSRALLRFVGLSLIGKLPLPRKILDGIIGRYST